MATKAKYHIDLKAKVKGRWKWLGTWEGSRIEAPIQTATLCAKRRCLHRTGQSCDSIFPHHYRELIHKAGVRVRFHGRVIAQWKNGMRQRVRRRVPQERGQ